MIRFGKKEPQSFSQDEPVLSRKHHGRGKRLILKSTAILPAMFTLGNAICGFASIHFATKDGLGLATFENLEIASWLIFISMVCDMLDGRVARMTRHTSDFGAQLDSMADVIAFGVAPAMLMLRAVIRVLRMDTLQLGFLQHSPAVERIVWIFAAVYVSCAAMRLARFNVENEPDESSHMNFKGLPSPGAAAAVAAIVLLLAHLEPMTTGWQASPWLLATVCVVLPIATVIAGLMMVSSFPYPHVVNQYIRTKRPFGYLVKLLLFGLAALVEVYIACALVAAGYAVSGPVRALLAKRTKKVEPPTTPAA